MITVTFLGAARSVTGSNFLIETKGGKRLLVDCGLFQGNSLIESRNRGDWGFDPAAIDAMILTHAHIDHSGRIPKLVKDGFRGPVFTSSPTAELCEIMLLDSAHVQAMDARWRTNKNARRGEPPVEPLYTADDVRDSLKYLKPVERDVVMSPAPGVRMRLRNAGHILGSCIIELWIEDDGSEIKLVFSGDLGNKNQLIVKDPDEIEDTQYLFMESTYGDRRHRTFEESRAELLEAINYAADRGEKVIIPAFALERTQEILYLLGEFHREGTLPQIPVYLDSPLAIKATEIFRRNKKYYDEEASAIVEKGLDPFDMPLLRFTPTAEESMAINKQAGPAIVISANGMCTAGRIKHHLKHNLWRPGSSLIIVGYQAEGTTGRKIVDGAKTVRIFREEVAVKARVFTIGGFSAHADQKGLLEWARSFRESNPRVFLVHGEERSSKPLAAKISNDLGLETYIPKWKESVMLTQRREIIPKRPAEPARSDRRGEELLEHVADMEERLGILREKLSDRAFLEKLDDNDLERLKRIASELEGVPVA
jgi:metallo-beta-lactamase family protein